MKKVVLDGKKITDREALHKILKKELRFPEYYGENLDALWDCLTTDVELPLTIEWENFEFSAEFLGEYLQSTLEIFRSAEEYTKGKLKIEIKK